MPISRPVSGSRVAIVGGSIAGCAAAIALRRAGCQVTVLERSGGELKDRGFGLGIARTVCDDLVAHDYLGADLPGLPCEQIVWMTNDGSHEGRVLLRQSLPAIYHNWALLWRELRDRVADQDYRTATTVRELRSGPSSVTVVTEDGAEEAFDLVVGADGHRSVVRTLIDPAATPGYAGYVLWRATYPASRLDPATRPEPGVGMGSVYPGGHAGCYLIPGQNPTEPLVNVVAYDSATTFDVPGWPVLLPPGSITEDLAARLDALIGEHLPARWAEVVRGARRDEISVQPIFDLPSTSYVADRALLIGDAATLVRPHTAAGAGKAMQDAVALETICRDAVSWADALTRYDEQRRPVGNGQVELGRRLGRDRVVDTPDWSAMSSQDFQDWLVATTGDASTMVPRYGSASPVSPQ